MTDDYTPGKGLPIGLPSASEELDASMQVRRRSNALGGTNTPRTSSVDRADGRVMGKALARIDAHMPERDRKVLRVVSQHRYLSTYQVQQFVFTDHSSDDSAARTARHVTQRLSRLGLLRPLERRVGGLRPGSAATIWQLAPAGARLLRPEADNYRTHQPSPRFLQHCLVVADVHLGVQQMTELSHVHAVMTETEPECWRRYVGPGGEQRWLQPDLFARLTSEDYVDHWFIEVDLGTESLPTLIKKCQQYENYRQTGIEQERRGGFPLVLWVFTKEHRIAQLREHLARSRSLTPALHRFATPATLRHIMEQGG